MGDENLTASYVVLVWVCSNHDSLHFFDLRLSVCWTMVIQKAFCLPARSRGVHLVTEEIVGQLPEISVVRVGLMHVFIKHTSASLTLNENADPTVRQDFERFLNQLVPEGDPSYAHVDEGPDDLPAHLKSSLLGNSLTIPITDGALNLGTWQGIYLCEHRNHGGGRTVVVTIQGE